jgi:hypothetical protein
MTSASIVGFASVRFGLFSFLGDRSVLAICTGWKILIILRAGDFCGVDAIVFILLYRGGVRVSVEMEFYLLVWLGCGF